MYSEQTIKKLAKDTLLIKLQDYLLTYDIGPMERLNRAIALTDFWIAEGEEFKRLRKTIKQDNKPVIEHLRPYYAYWHKRKLLCEGKELSAENVSNMDLDEVFKFRDSVLHITTDDD